MSAPGSSPGSLIHIGERRSEAVTFEVHTYNSRTCTCERLESPAEVPAASAESGDITWIHVEGLHEVEDIAALGERFAIDALTLEDILNTRSRPKIEISPAGIFVVAETLCRIPDSDQYDIQHAAFLLLPGNVLISFLEGPAEVFNPVRTRLETGGTGRIRKMGPDYLLWALLDSIVDHYLHSLWAVEEAISGLEEKLQEDSESVSAQDLFAAKKESTRLYHLVRPIVEISTALTRSDSTLLAKKSRSYFQDLLDHAYQAKETAESTRDQTASLRDFHLAMVSHRMNEVMKVLTCFASIFLPLTFLAGIYGMNFDHIPELHWKWAYPTLWGIFGVLIIGMLWYFRRKKWL
jgi:magnesium transporter